MNQKCHQGRRPARRIAAALAIAGLSVPLAWAFGQPAARPASGPAAAPEQAAAIANQLDAWERTARASWGAAEAAYDAKAASVPVVEPGDLGAGTSGVVLTSMRQFGGAGGGGGLETPPPPIQVLPTDDARSAATWELLQKEAAAHFEGNPLKEAIQILMQAAAGENTPPLDYYIDPLGLQDADKTADEPVTLNFQRVPIRMTLRLILRENGLTFVIRDGLVIITNAETESDFWPGDAGLGRPPRTAPSLAPSSN